MQPWWTDRATGWIADRLTTRGSSPTGEVEQVHIRPWSTVLRVPTSEGVLRFRSEIAESVPYGLQRFLAGGPIGTWRLS